VQHEGGTTWFAGPLSRQAAIIRPMTSTSRLDRAGLVGFAALVVLIGANLVAIRFSNRELAPFWGAGLRFAVAAILFAAIVVVTRRPWPRGRLLAISIAYGLLSFAGFFAFLYWGLVEAPAAYGQIILSTGPLLTLFLSVAHGTERFQRRVLLGGGLALIGMAVAFAGGSRADVPAVSLLAILAAAASFAEGGIVVRGVRGADPIAVNGVASLVGAILLLTLAFVLGEPRGLPARPETWVSLVYLVTGGTIVVFLLFLFLVRRWQPSSVAYQFVLAPLVAVVLAAVLAGEPITPAFAVGAGLVILGVVVGALLPDRRA
jgi:drug/metabolite transporter (DMT)-like permease